MTNHINHILVAEFDIDKGSQLTHQFPEKTGIEEHKLAELMLPDGAHLREEDWTSFILNQHTVEDKDLQTLPIINNETNLLYVLNLVRTKQIPGVRRGARVKAIAITSHHKWLHVFKPLLIMALDSYFEKQEISILEKLYKSMNCLDISLMPLLSYNEKIILRASDDPMLFNESFQEMEDFAVSMNKYNNKIPSNSQIKKIDRHFYETNVLYDIGAKNPIKVPIKIPMTMFNGEIGDLSVIQLISTFGNSAYPTKHHPHLDNNMSTNPIIILINALLTQKRILFLGHLKPSGEVANFVLAACALGSCGILRGYSERCFPYTNLAGLDDLLKVPGFIAGVTNPAFEEHPQWWDVLFNINTGKVTISPNIEKAPTIVSNIFTTGEKDGPMISSFDKEFMNDIMSLIQQKYGEHYIRERFRLYLLRFIEVAAEYENIIYGKTKIGYTADNFDDKYNLGVGAFFTDEISKRKEIVYNVNRIEGWRKTKSYELYKKVNNLELYIYLFIIYNIFIINIET
ncbi:hypothetical protein PIROE2DRAFT_49092 [Piromyces sp. E2]|nr:hypothetical protein PIROE2DRAFT_49092 [Piromyces sp. E2]|eukprot:OUM56981.1 hypothetical protein PIROE2DRAFT_49092 [Piromyces sp. E2]